MWAVQLCIKVLLIFALFKYTEARIYKSPVLIYGYKASVTRPVFPPIKPEEFKEILNELKQKFTMVLFLENNLKADILSCDDHSLECFGGFPVSHLFTFYGCVENPHITINDAVEKVEVIHADSYGNVISFGCEMIKLSTLYVVQTAKSYFPTTPLLTTRVNTIRHISQKLHNCGDPPIFLFVNNREGVYMDENCTSIYGNPPALPEGNEFTMLVKAYSTTIAKGIIIIDTVTPALETYQKIGEVPQELNLKVKKKLGYFLVYEAKFQGKKYFARNVKWLARRHFAEHGAAFGNGNQVLRVNLYNLDVNDFIKPIQYPWDFSEDDIFITPGIASGLLVTAILCSVGFVGFSMLMNIKINEQVIKPLKPLGKD